MLSFFPRDVLNEILDLIESVSEGFPSYSLVYLSLLLFKKMHKIYANSVDGSAFCGV